VGRHVSDGYAVARPSLGHFTEKTKIVSTTRDHLEHGRCGAGR